MMKRNSSPFNNDALKLFNFMNGINKTIDSRIVDISSIVNILSFAYYGIEEKKRKELFDKTNLKNIIKYAPISMNSRCGVFIKKGNEFTEDYLSKYNDNIVLSYIPTNKKEKTLVNKLILEKFPKWNIQIQKNFLNDYIPANIPLFIKDQSYFKGEWERQFFLDTTEHQDFFIGNDKKISIPMMYVENITLDTYESERLNSIFVSMRYEKNNHSMLIIMPHIAHTKEELIDFYKKELTANDIKMFYENRKEVDYFRYFFPKFQFETEWYLNNELDFEDDCSYLKKLLDPNVTNFNNISKNLNQLETIDFVSSSKISCNEIGTEIFTKSLDYTTDYMPKNPKILRINKNFIFMIMNENFMISKIGIFVGK